MAAPVGHLTIKFDSIKFNSLGLLVIKEVQMVFLTSTVINNNEYMKELERKIKCEKLMFR